MLLISSGVYRIDYIHPLLLVVAYFLSSGRFGVISGRFFFISGRLVVNCMLVVYI